MPKRITKKQQQLEKMNSKYFQAIKRTIELNGHFIQGVNGGVSYTVGLAFDKGFEIFCAQTVEGMFPLAGEMLNVTKKQSYLPCHHIVFESKNSYVTVNEEHQASRYGFINVTDTQTLYDLATKACYGWLTVPSPTAPERVVSFDVMNRAYMAVASDIENKLPWEEGYTGVDPMKQLHDYLNSRTAL